MRYWCAILVLSIAVSLPAAAGVLDDLTRQQHYTAQRASSSNEDLTRNGDARSIAPGGMLVLADLEGPGMITQFWHTVASYDPFCGRSLVLRIYYDGNEKPSVVTPLGDFFAEPHGNVNKDFTSEPVLVTGMGRSRTCYWKMPFLKHLKMTLSNDAKEKVDSFYYHLNWRKYDALPEDTTYFHALYRQEFPAKPGNYTILDAQGSGHYVGTVLGVHQVETGWFGEGDEFFTVDGAARPQLCGTGSEEYFLDAWGMREFFSPYAGVVQYEGIMAGDRVGAYRWHLQDPVPFTKSLHVEIEHKGSIFNEKAFITDISVGNFEERPDWFSSVAFWYQKPPLQLEEALPPVEKRVAPYRVLDPAALTSRADPPFLLIPSELGLSYVPSIGDAWIEFDFDVEQDGRYQLSGMFMYGIVGGIYQPYLDGKAIGGPLDFVIVNYNPGFANLDLHELKAGKHTLRFESKAGRTSPILRSELPALNGFHFIRLFVLRLEDMEGYRQKLNELIEKKK